jgi:flagellar hook assembly protein FlgD
MAGRLVTTLVNEKKAPGNYMVQWDGRDETGKLVATGVYFYRLQVGSGIVKTKKMLFVK